MSVNFIDRRDNPKGKSLGNKQRFKNRVKEQIREAVKESLDKSSIKDIDKDRTVTVPKTKSTDEPRFRKDYSVSGDRDFVLPGNKKFVPDDLIQKPPGGGGRGQEGSENGEGEDSFQFVIPAEEVLDIFFEGLELPPMVKTTLKDSPKFETHRAGTTTSGTQMDLLRTMRRAVGRNLALKRPKLSDVERMEEEIRALGQDSAPDLETSGKIAALQETLDKAVAKRKWVPFIDPTVDVRFKSYAKHPKPYSKAVMFCLMDVSGSMGEHEKDLAKRFYMLLNLFLKKKYEKVDVVFIRHTQDATEVNEQEFFYGVETGGTIVSKAFDEMLRIVRERYAPGDWNIYAAQASDGDNLSQDMPRCVKLLNQDILPISRHFAYLEVREKPRATELWDIYSRHITAPHFAMKQAFGRKDIFPVFRQLFEARNFEALKAG